MGRKYTYRKRIGWSKLKKDKPSIKEYKKRYGTERAIYFSEGILGLRRGEYLKYRPRIRRFVKKL